MIKMVLRHSLKDHKTHPGTTKNPSSKESTDLNGSCIPNINKIKRVVDNIVEHLNILRIKVDMRPF